MTEPVTIRGVTIHLGDSRAVLELLPDASVDSVVCDPPYALDSIRARFGGKKAAKAKSNGATGVYGRVSAGFMGQEWDTEDTAFDPDFWALVRRKCKPGAHLYASAGTRKYHWLAMAIELGGWEIVDQAQWLYGTGMPANTNLAKGWARRRKDEVEDIRKVCRFVRDVMTNMGTTSAEIAKAFDCHSRLVDHWAARDTDSQPSVPKPDQWAKLKELLPLGDSMDDLVAQLNDLKGTAGEDWTGAAVVGEHTREGGLTGIRHAVKDKTIRDLDHVPEELRRAGTRMAPACEPAVLARNPISEATIMDNIMRWGTGGIQIEACRIPGEPGEQGRWPKNVIHDGSPEVLAAFGEGLAEGEENPARFFQVCQATEEELLYWRFRYTDKADAEDRLGSEHPTVKPVSLMAYWCRLLTPPGGVVLDPFAGTGTTGVAAQGEGLSCVLVEREKRFYDDIIRRFEWMEGRGKITALEQVKMTPEREAKAVGADTPLFAGLGGET